MDKRLIYCALLVMLSGRFVGTLNTTTAPPSTMLTTPTTKMTATAESSSTSPTNVSTTPTTKMTATAESSSTSPTSVSTTPTTKMTTTAESSSTSPTNVSTTPTTKMTATAESSSTSPSNVSTTPTTKMTATEVSVTSVSMTASTQFVPVSPNTTVLTLEANVTNAECGSKQLCVAEPSRCDPFVTGSCFFFAAKQESGRNFNFDLSGESNGYIAATLTAGGGQGDPTYICANSKGKVKFFSSILYNGVLNISELNVNSVKGKIKGKTIQCRFLATVPEPKTRATTLGVAVSTGEYNDTNDGLGAPTPVIKVSAVDLANPDNNVTNEIANTTTPAPTGNNATTVAPTGALIPQLSTVITRQECGTTKLCAAEPSKCDPAAGSSCYFLSVKQQSGQIYNFELSGQSDGYVAAGLSNSENKTGTHTAYICANENGNVRFFTGTIDNLVINLKSSQNSSNERGTVNGNKIQCTFSADLPDNSVRTANYALSVSTGSYDAKTLQLGQTTFQLLTSRTNLSDPTANLTNLLNNAAINYTPSFFPALLVTVYMLAFTAM
ncbi:mucin-5AC-like [Xiphophorus hellerii]|uniref:mucin-5AC-like n=1 Tax=Xiphophorus hellerii TaxID=8084 RepID=UPI0013B46A79|nr:mucin-5AC-like [Xiphophorus hellerii]